MVDYAELHCHSYFSLLDGASSPEALAQRAAELSLPALAITDHDGLYGVIRFQRAAIEAGVRAIIGAEVTLSDGSHLTLLAQNARGYSNLSRLISYAHQRQPKGKAALDPRHIREHSDGLVCLSGCRNGPLSRLILKREHEAARHLASRMVDWFTPGNLAIELQRQVRRDDHWLSAALAVLADELGLPVVATGNVHYAVQDRSRLQDVLTCIKHNVTLDEAGDLLRGNSDAYLHSAEEMTSLFVDRPDALKNAAAIAERCQVSLDFSSAGVPKYPLSEGDSADDHLRCLCEEALARCYPEGNPAAREQLEHELGVIRETGLSEYFLVVYDIVAFARRNGIRCQGRGSAANSIVAYLLGISAVDPLKHNLLFERFLSVERYNLEKSAPDIDLDIERDRREEVIQYVYRRYGWEHTAMVCTLVSFRGRSAIRDVGKVLGFAPEAIDEAAKGIDFYTASKIKSDTLSHILGEDADAPRWNLLFDLCRQIAGFPRHLGIHVGGMVVTRRPLVEVVPIEPATMPGRVVVQWDKDDVADAGLVKIDLLSLAMLSVMNEAVDLVERTCGVKVDIEQLSMDDPAVYDLICSGDTIGVFQVESRAQAQMLPRLRPRSFDDLVIEVSLLRPGPIQGNMVNPYLLRRRGEEPVSYDHPAMEKSLQDTLGIIVFQEQVLMVARDVAGFSPGEGELLRRAMGRKRSKEEMEKLRQRFVVGALANGATEEQANRVYDSLAAFAEFGFNRSHAASFALISYATAWLKRYYPLQFYTALLNNWPVGFYSPDVVVEDAKRHGIRLLPVDINRSDERCIIEDRAIRLGLNYIRGFGPELARSTMEARQDGFTSLEDLCRRVSLSKDSLEALIMAGGCDSWGKSRRELLWRLPRCIDQHQPELVNDLPQVKLPKLSDTEALANEYDFSGVTSGANPAALFRRALTEAGALPSTRLADAPAGAWVRVGGQRIVLQRPGSAKGFVFITLSDEWGLMNLVIRPPLYRKYRLYLAAPGLLAEGRVERDDGVVNIIVERLWPLFPEVH